VRRRLWHPVGPDAAAVLVPPSDAWDGPHAPVPGAADVHQLEVGALVQARVPEVPGLSIECGAAEGAAAAHLALPWQLFRRRGRRRAACEYGRARIMAAGAARRVAVRRRAHHGVIARLPQDVEAVLDEVAA